MCPAKKNSYIVGLDEVGLKDIELVGGKNASLGEMIRNLTKIGIKIPKGFVITVKGYKRFIEYNNLEKKIQDIISNLRIENIESLNRTGLQVRQLIKNGKFPSEMETQIIKKHFELSETYGQEVTDVAVRSSATAEDLPDASFAGQQETYLNVRGPESLLIAVRNCFASLFTNRAISYRERFKYDHFQIGLAVGIQKMVRSDLASSGVAFSLDTESGFKDVVLINASYGLGEMIVQGSVSPDEFIIFKPTLKQGYNSIIEKNLGFKNKKMIYGQNPDERVKIVSVEKRNLNKFAISDDIALKIADWAIKIEDYYTNLNGKWSPVDIEWAIDGLSKELFIVQARPETIHAKNIRDSIIEYKINDKNKDNKLLAKGIAVGDKIGAGKVKIMYSLEGRDGSTAGEHFEPNDILVTEMTDPDWEPLMKKASAIVTNKGGRTCHAAIVAREMGIPAIVGCKDATEILDTDQLITVSCAEGNVGYVYSGEIKFSKSETKISKIPKVKTPIMMNVASPDIAFNYSYIPNAGVGLAREEFIINNYIQAHPLALLKHNEMKDEELSDNIRKLITGYEDEETFFIKRLSYGISKIAAAFYPNKVIVRFSDFKSNEYKNLLGGTYFEPDEENPMIGWRGASRYYSKEYKEAFGLECKAVLRVREEKGLKNVVVMIPFCRTVDEMKKVLDTMAEYGLERGKDGLEVFLMAELPSNIILAEEFAQYIDGFSIGSNDLTQLTLGLDRDSSLVAHLYDERNNAVKGLLRTLIKTAKKTKTKVGICGQGPSDFPDFAQFLVEEGIDTISVTPDSVLKTLKAIKKVENNVGKK